MKTTTTNTTNTTKAIYDCSKMKITSYFELSTMEKKIYDYFAECKERKIISLDMLNSELSDITTVEEKKVFKDKDLASSHIYNVLSAIYTTIAYYNDTEKFTVIPSFDYNGKNFAIILGKKLPTNLKLTPKKVITELTIEEYAKKIAKTCCSKYFDINKLFNMVKKDYKQLNNEE